MTEDLEHNITTNLGNASAGIPCSQTFSCSWINPDGNTNFLVYYANGTGPIEYDSLPGEIIFNEIFNCSNVNGSYNWYISGIDGPVSNQVICEATPYPDTTTVPETTTTVVTCLPGGTWSSWSSSSSCNDTCGMFGVTIQNRTCTSSSNGCPCTGNATQQGSDCGPVVCHFPRQMCRNGYNRVALNSQIICVAGSGRRKREHDDFV